MKSLPDPRTYARHTGNPLALLAGQADTDASALQQGSAGESLRQAVEQALDAGDDGLIRQALQEVSSERAYASLVRSIEAALDPPGDSPVAVRLFAIPILVITGGTTAATIPGVLPAAAPLQALFE